MYHNKVRNDKTSRVLKALVNMAEKEFVPSIGPIKGKIVAKIIKKCKPRNILEIGTLYGYSAILMASMLPSSNGRVVTIEIDKSVAEGGGMSPMVCLGALFCSRDPLSVENAIATLTVHCSSAARGGSFSGRSTPWHRRSRCLKTVRSRRETSEGLLAAEQLETLEETR